MGRAGLMLVVVLLPVSLPAQVESRWALAIPGPVTAERGELRLHARGGRLLLERSDTSWISLRDFRRVDGRIAFTLPGSARRFDGEITALTITGTVTEPDGHRGRWNAEFIQPGISRWPVRPRVRIRQVLLGTGASTVILPAAWRAILPTTTAVAAERDALAQAVGVRAPTPDDLVQAQRVSLGFDSAGRTAARAVLRRIATGAAADTEFLRIFGTAARLRIDLHQVAFALAAAKGASLRIPPDAMARGLAMFATGFPVANDSLSLYAAAWRAWSQARTDSTEAHRVFEQLGVVDSRTGEAVRALFAAYDEAVRWWADAVQWLLNHDWIETADGRRSPAALVARFWGRSKLNSPPLEPTHFGSAQAVPVVGAARLGARLVRPLNASADEWLALEGLASALTVWREIDTSDTLTVVRNGRSTQLTSPAAVARSRLGGFLAGRDAIRIEPGISPIFAVVTALHEWQHLLFEGARLEGSAPGLADTPDELRFLDGNPWLAEGAAEWATEAILEPARQTTPLLPFMEALKRGSIDVLAGRDDPHVLGYLLVRALAERNGDLALLRGRLVRLLHDPAALAREYGIAGSVRGLEPIRLNRPGGAGVIPEMAFTWDDGVAENLVRRLQILAHPEER